MGICERAITEMSSQILSYSERNVAFIFNGLVSWVYVDVFEFPLSPCKHDCIRDLSKESFVTDRSKCYRVHYEDNNKWLQIICSDKKEQVNQLLQLIWSILPSEFRDENEM